MTTSLVGSSSPRLMRLVFSAACMLVRLGSASGMKGWMLALVAEGYGHRDVPEWS